MTARSLWFAVAVCLATAFAGSSAQSQGRDLNTDRPGQDIREFELTAPLPDRCEAACNKEKDCQAWTFAWPGKKGPRARCFLKSGLPPKKSDNCCISGVRTEKFAPEPVAPQQADQEIPTSPSTEPQQQAEPDLPLEDACRQYAETAVDQNRQNNELFCDLTGSRWGHGYDVYFNWCMTKSTKTSRTANAEARDRELGACKAYFGIRERKKPKPRRDLARENACRDYANKSVIQSEEARELGCRFGGPRWSTSYDSHFSWCMDAGMADHATEILERNLAIRSCRPSQSEGADCEQYARTAFRLARQNNERKCGFIGPRWHTSIDAHVAWCLTAGLNEREREQNARHKALAACAGGPRKVSACARYAQRALKHAHANQDRDCGFVGPRWSADYEPHFIWCMNSKRKRRNAETVARVRSLRRCPGGRKFDEFETRYLYKYRWKRIPESAGSWNSGWIRSGSRSICEHKVTGCRCGWQNHCADFRDGDIALWWRNGCLRRPWKIKCEVEKR